ncbi:MAG TPA: undecaprenyldiphospho-muramoylpentapeptide beta-N-acetylglucosaminyltransferase [Cyanobacteria bacterium UBA11149]|nr:undecaprenyldiphospho-muramoylpentapeptide beta-N-acetylglucosaminyltransferase [Cyanobacteria bacterium UBA11367]HBE56908.1 undecaprenyldiphospho-muramoylpentapeptide beta-N-acetylglucosaminyltransferase [Cyanobacteria bacterium UBA11366]HBK64101.1 undecaprenyldiphospho-muramoylpentapeptide beta-N-acetylglucosaminyltransferase [Cyanobacteria bacterium UBA11166]HBR75295.1 undecaprenyldiphospho-muramoylpentapeptide beta-N-acetylglucosaminyltransferase [Cyanobacteria bacterium UBA11159]HBS7238
MEKIQKRLLIAASGTGGHIFPALALAENLPEYKIGWLGVPNRAEKNLVPPQYYLQEIKAEGFQKPFGLATIRTALGLITSIYDTWQILLNGPFDGVFTTGGYIAAPAIIAARILGLPVILHESNAIPGKVTRLLGPLCTAVALGFEDAAKHLPLTKTLRMGTPVRPNFFHPKKLDLPIPEDVPVVVVVGGSQGAVAVNQLVRQCANTLFDAGIWIVHLTGDNDPDAGCLQHPQYIQRPFYNDMPSLLHRANLAISRAGASALAELAITKTPAILIPYPYAAENHQAYNAAAFVQAGAAVAFLQEELTPEILGSKVLELLNSPETTKQMAERAHLLSMSDSAERLAIMVRYVMDGKKIPKVNS